jgi:RNA polymerase sigma-70 factor (ECF subfamily)
LGCGFPTSESDRQISRIRLSSSWFYLEADAATGCSGTSAMSSDSRWDDSLLVQRCLSGDGGAFQSLAERYYRPISSFLYKRLQRIDVVEDLAQETFLEAFRSLKTGQRPLHFSSWLFGIAHNLCGKWLRRKRPVLFDPAEAPEVAAGEPEFAAQEELEEQQKRLAELDAGLTSLPDEVRRVLEMKHKHGRTCDQIAADLGRPSGTIKSLLSRAYKALRDRLRPNGEDGQ